MSTNVRRRVRRAAVAGVCAAGMLLTAGATMGASAGAAVAQPQARVPWSQAGPGWELAEYTNSTAAKHEPTTLYLVSPGGAKYAVYTWRASSVLAPRLMAWSGDKTHALFNGIIPELWQLQLNLITGKLTRITLQGGASAIGYTRPNGLNILGVRTSANGLVTTLARYTLTGVHVKDLTTFGKGGFDAVYSADGTTIAVSGSTGVRLVSNAGGVIRTLKVPGTDPRTGCIPERYWNAGTILAECFAKPSGIARLWLVPVSGARPTALTPQRTHGAHDFDAWRLNSGLYLQSSDSGGALVLNKQNANGSVSPVNVPHTLNINNSVRTANGNRLLLDALTNSSGGSSLLWFNPGTRAEQWLIKAPANTFGVLAVVPF